MNKGKISIGMALVDAIPVLLFAYATEQMWLTINNKCFMIGAIACFAAGLGKVLWKFLFAIMRKSIDFLYKQFKYLMSLGFVLMLVGGLVELNNYDLKEVAAAIFNVPCMVCLVISIGALVCMIQMARTLDQFDAKANWKEQGVNIVAQGAFLLAVMSVGFSPVGVFTNHVDVKVSMDNASVFNDGKFEGWGTSFCWWANRLGYNDTLAEEAAKSFYSDEGLNMNIIRYNIGGGDDPSHKHITRTDSEVPGYAVNPKEDGDGNLTWDYDWSKDADQRNVLLKVAELNNPDLIVEGFSNSAPYFMTESGCSSGAEKASNDNLREDCYDDFAKYIADVTKHYEEAYAISFQSYSAMNEPETDYWEAMSWKQEGCHFDMGKSQSKMLVELDKALKNQGLDDVLVTASDETSIDTQMKAFKKLSPEAKDVVDRIDTHSYMGSKRYGLRNLALDSNKNLWMSEVDSGDVAGKNAGEMGAGLDLGLRIVDDLNGLRPSAWVLWQIVDNHICAEGRNGNEDYGMVDVNGGYWGPVVADHDKNQLIYTMKYYSYGQFTRYIRPGDTIVATGKNTIAAVNEGEGRIVIVAVNDKDKDINYSFDLSGIRFAGTSAKVIRTSGNMETGEKWKELDAVAISNQTLSVDLKANSITTFVIE